MSISSPDGLIPYERIYTSQPDAFIFELRNLSDWEDLFHRFDLGDQSRRAATAAWVQQHGVQSLHFGPMPATVLHQDASHWDFLVDGVDNCARAVLELVAAVSRGRESPLKVYAAEALSPFAMALRATYPFFLGTQFMPDPETQKELYPIGHQDLESLTLPSERFDVSISIEVLEHVADLRASLNEQFRILKSGGLLLATFPFDFFSNQTLVKAIRLKDGSVRHLMQPPEYHGDTMTSQGILTYRLIGWDIINEAEAVGFSSSCFVYYSSVIGGVMGYDLSGRFIFTAKK